MPPKGRLAVLCMCTCPIEILRDKIHGKINLCCTSAHTAQQFQSNASVSQQQWITTQTVLILKTNVWPYTYGHQWKIPPLVFHSPAHPIQGLLMCIWPPVCGCAVSAYQCMAVYLCIQCIDFIIVHCSCITAPHRTEWHIENKVCALAYSDEAGIDVVTVRPFLKTCQSHSRMINWRKWNCIQVTWNSKWIKLQHLWPICPKPELSRFFNILTVIYL